MKAHFEFQEIQEVGSQFVTLVPTRIVPDDPEKVFETVEETADRIMTGSMRNSHSNRLSKDGKTIIGYVK